MHFWEILFEFIGGINSRFVIKGVLLGDGFLKSIFYFIYALKTGSVGKLKILN